MPDTSVVIPDEVEARITIFIYQLLANHVSMADISNILEQIATVHDTHITADPDLFELARKKAIMLINGRTLTVDQLTNIRVKLPILANTHLHVLRVIAENEYILRKNLLNEMYDMLNMSKVVVEEALAQLVLDAMITIDPDVLCEENVDRIKITKVGRLYLSRNP